MPTRKHRLLIAAAIPISLAGYYVKAWIRCLISSAACKLIRLERQRGVVLLLILLGLFDSSSVVGDGPQATAAGNPKLISIPFELDTNLIFVPVSVNGSKPLSFILDTGSFSMMNATRAQAQGLTLQLVGQTNGIGAHQQSVFLIKGQPTYGPPGAVMKGQRLLAVPLAQVEDCFNKASSEAKRRDTLLAQERKGGGRRAIDGILGKEFFSRFVVEIDYPARMVNVYDPATYTYTGRGERFKLEMAPQHIYVRAAVKAAGRGAIKGRFQVDTGYATVLCLTKEFIEANKLMPPVEKLERAPVCGLAGDVAEPSWVGTLERLELGSIRIDNPDTEFSQSDFNQDFDGFIGGVALMPFKVIFDYSREMMILEASAKK